MPFIAKSLAGAAVGAVAGFLYYKAVGCPGGTCPITKSPYRTALYGAILGLMIAVS